MTDSSPMSVSKGIHKLQLSLLDGVGNEEQLFTAGALLSRSDYEDIVTERSISSLCGYPSCGRSLHLEDGRKGRYHISLKEHKVYDLEEARKFCSSACLVKSRAFSTTLPSERRSDLEWGYVDNILKAFGDLSVDRSGNQGKKGELGDGFVKIVEKMDVAGEISLDDWIGPTGSIEGYLPREKYESSRSSKFDDQLIHQKSVNKDKEGNEANFTSSILFGNQGDIRETGRDAEINFTSAIIVTEDKSRALGNLNQPKKADYHAKENKLATKILSGNQGSVMETVAVKKSQVLLPFNLPGPETELKVDELMESCKIQSDCSPERAGIGESSKPTNELVDDKDGLLKSCLKYSQTRKLGRSVTWGDEKRNNNVGEVALCSYLEGKSERSGSNDESFGGNNDRNFRLESAEVCALALAQAADDVASGELQALEAVSGAGITILPSGHDANGSSFSESLDIESDIAPCKWPQKTVLLDTDAFACDDSWHDAPPDGFSLNLSSFATMYMTLFGWASSASLAYIYGQSESMQSNFSFLKGREYPRKAVLSDGKSLEIKRALEGCISRALPELIAGLRTRTPLSNIEKAMVFLLGTLSLTDPLPPFRTRQWQVIVILFLDALSVQRVTSLAESMANNRMLIHRILDGAGVSAEEYEIMKDLLLPLGRSPEFSSQCGA